MLIRFNILRGLELKSELRLFRVFDLRQQLIAFRSIRRAAGTADVRFVMMFFFLASERATRTGGGRIDRGLRFGEMAFADTDAVESGFCEFG